MLAFPLRANIYIITKIFHTTDILFSHLRQGMEIGEKNEGGKDEKLRVLTRRKSAKDLFLPSKVFLFLPWQGVTQNSEFQFRINKVPLARAKIKLFYSQKDGV